HLLLCLSPSPSTAPPPRSPLSLHDALPISFLWDTELRTGDAGTWAGSRELLASCFLSIPSDIRELRVRADAGFGYGPNPQLADRSEEHTSELQSRFDLVCRLLLEKKKQ